MSADEQWSKEWKQAPACCRFGKILFWSHHFRVKAKSCQTTEKKKVYWRGNKNFRHARISTGGEELKCYLFLSCCMFVACGEKPKLHGQRLKLRKALSVVTIIFSINYLAVQLSLLIGFSFTYLSFFIKCLCNLFIQFYAARIASIVG